MLICTLKHWRCILLCIQKLRHFSLAHEHLDIFPFAHKFLVKCLSPNNGPEGPHNMLTKCSVDIKAMEPNKWISCGDLTLHEICVESKLCRFVAFRCDQIMRNTSCGFKEFWKGVTKFAYFLSWTVIYILWGYLEKAIVTLLLFSFCYQHNSFHFERDETTECRGSVPMLISGLFIGETKAVVKGVHFPEWKTVIFHASAIYLQKL